MTDIDCGWPDPQLNQYIKTRLVNLLGPEEAKRLARRAVARYYPRPTDEAINRQLRASWGYGLSDMKPIEYL